MAAFGASCRHFVVGGTQSGSDGFPLRRRQQLHVLSHGIKSHSRAHAWWETRGYCSLSIYCSVETADSRPNRAGGSGRRSLYCDVSELGDIDEFFGGIAPNAETKCMRHKLLQHKRSRERTGQSASGGDPVPDSDFINRRSHRANSRCSHSESGVDDAGAEAPREKKRYPHRFWTDKANVIAELRSFIAQHRIPKGVAPTLAFIRAKGATSLERAILRNGGLVALSTDLGLKTRQKKAGYWKQPGALEEALAPYVQAHPAGMPAHLVEAITSSGGMLHAMPTKDQLLAVGREDLVRAVTLAGGFRKVAARMGLRVRRGHFENFDALALDVLAFTRTLGVHGEMPTARQLEECGRKDLLVALRARGYAQVASQLGLQYKPGREQGKAGQAKSGAAQEESKWTREQGAEVRRVQAGGSRRVERAWQEKHFAEVRSLGR
eukprot:jgi/Mesvir1/23691/Mv18644-RA.1